MIAQVQKFRTEDKYRPYLVWDSYVKQEEKEVCSVRNYLVQKL